MPSLLYPQICPLQYTPRTIGTTIGILVYLRDPTVGCDQSDAIDPELLGVLASQGTMNKPSTSWSVGYGFLDSLSKLFVPPTGVYGDGSALGAPGASGNNRTLSSSASMNASRASPAVTNSTTKVSTTALSEQQQQSQQPQQQQQQQQQQQPQQPQQKGSSSQKEGSKENNKEVSNKDSAPALSTLRTSSQSIHQASMNSLDIYGNDKHEEASR